MVWRSRRYIFLLIQMILYGTFLTLDIVGRNTTLSNRIKFAIVALCFIYVIINSRDDLSRQKMYLCSALAFTVISDIIILFSNYYIYGVLTFIIAQQLYGRRITELYKRENLASSTISPIKDLWFRVLLQATIGAIISILLWVLDVYIDLLLAVSILYFVSICTNVMRSLKLSKNFKDRRDIRYFAIGFVLFLLCDINVGLFNVSDFMPTSSGYNIIYSFSSILMWTFYAPSQVLLALSGDNY